MTKRERELAAREAAVLSREIAVAEREAAAADREARPPTVFPLIPQPHRPQPPGSPRGPLYWGDPLDINGQSFHPPYRITY